MSISSQGTSGISDFYTRDAELFSLNSKIVKGNTIIGYVRKKEQGSWRLHRDIWNTSRVAK